MDNRDLECQARQLLFTATANERSIAFIESRAAAALRRGEPIPEDLMEKIETIRSAATFLRQCGQKILHETMFKAERKHGYFEDN